MYIYIYIEIQRILVTYIPELCLSTPQPPSDATVRQHCTRGDFAGLPDCSQHSERSLADTSSAVFCGCCQGCVFIVYVPFCITPYR